MKKGLTLDEIIKQNKDYLKTQESVYVSDSHWEDYLKDNMFPCAHTEYNVLSFNFSDVLLDYDRVIIHGVALRWRDHAYLICAKSGTGKSTQAKYLQELRPGEFGIICGDRPVLQFCEKNSSKTAKVGETEIIVHPSLWNGKENWFGADAAPLAGLILLERGNENKIVSLSEREAAVLLYTQFVHTARNAQIIKKVAELETKLLHSVPIWRLTTHQVPDSTKILLETVFS